MGGKAGEGVSSVFGELPALGFQLEVDGDERPIDRWHPVGNVVVFVDPGPVIGRSGGISGKCAAAHAWSWRKRFRYW